MRAEVGADSRIFVVRKEELGVVERSSQDLPRCKVEDAPRLLSRNKLLHESANKLPQSTRLRRATLHCLVPHRVAG